eukprot:TRINITY_DN437_c0_g2_i3.p1 TRINITY_DN437_c0_g2~~TRINITY_DN437_c0_g2_i3.p1  ORF type:complete len:347 (-),score=19.21 TRINITY_DN437_c0_g2_i3:1617-2657(-)
MVFACLRDAKDLAACSGTCRLWLSLVWPSVRHLNDRLGFVRACQAATKCPHLLELNVKWTPDDGDSRMREIVGKCPELQSLQLFDLRGDCWSEARAFTSLCHLLLHFADDVSAVVSVPWPSLTSLDIKARHVELQQVPVGLRVLRLCGQLRVTSTALSCLSNLSKLRLTGGCFGSSLSRLTALRCLERFGRVDQQVSSAFSNLSSLTSLVLFGSHDVSPTLPTSLVRFSGDVEKVDNLHQLSRLTDVTALYGWREAKLCDLPRLESLFFLRLDKRTPVPDYRRLSSLQSLRSLVVNRLVDADTPVDLSNLTMLTSLSIAVPRDADVEMYDGLKSLLPECRMRFVFD